MGLRSPSGPVKAFVRRLPDEVRSRPTGTERPPQVPNPHGSKAQGWQPSRALEALTALHGVRVAAILLALPRWTPKGDLAEASPKPCSAGPRDPAIGWAWARGVRRHLVAEVGVGERFAATPRPGPAQWAARALQDTAQACPGVPGSLAGPRPEGLLAPGTEGHHPLLSTLAGELCISLFRIMINGLHHM